MKTIFILNNILGSSITPLMSFDILTYEYLDYLCSEQNTRGDNRMYLTQNYRTC